MTTIDTTQPRESGGSSRPQSKGVWLNDCHSQLNRTLAMQVVRPTCLDDLFIVVRQAKKTGCPLIPFGNRHSMGAQQFGSDVVAVDTGGLKRILNLEAAKGILEVEAGITWTGIQQFLDQSRANHGEDAGANGWAISQKQTGADELTIGGALSANVHGRGLAKRPIISDVDSFTIVNADGKLIECSRNENVELFRLAIGGYGLFGLIYSVRLQLVPRQKVQRIVRSIEAGAVMKSFKKRISAGYQYGDFQFHIDDKSDGFLNRGIFSCYRPVPDETVMPNETLTLKTDDWLNLLHLAHVDKSRGFKLYEEHYHKTDQSVYWSDTHQFTTYVDGYHRDIDQRMGSKCKGSEMISELYVPRDHLPEFLSRARESLRENGASVIYGTVRLIESDRESFLAWARESWACVIFNICVEHSQPGLEKARKTFCQLIDCALGLRGSYYLTYHNFARRDQVEAAHPRFAEFLQMKDRFDPAGMFQSNWWLHHKKLFLNA